ncbi:thermonuclease family protein [Caldovatus aquaticus]|uniref:Thermonuclease family protein n=1 Tax=Caldovatus aquaticus TaxID=2865671 RepID=A0ABS7EWZ9_9PROT|nr:thermonuclease family protein [Caldovatus aquaticus]MBW8267890.1 thermonuclease family protein [Caldovatus aquaticus]
MPRRAPLLFGLALLAVALGVLLRLGLHRDRLEPAPSSPAPGPVAALQGAARVVDGDTLEVMGRRVRLYGIDAPESDQDCERDGRAYACGAAAARALADLVAGREVRCAGRGEDRYGRTIAVCRANGTDLGEAMVRSGWAVAFRRYAEDYAAAETAARREGRGLWAGRFEAPEDWRRRRPPGR